MQCYACVAVPVSQNRVIEILNLFHLHCCDVLDAGELLVKLNEPLLHEADERGRPSSITLVTGLFDLGRGKLKDEAEFKRPFSEYIRRFRSFLAYKMPKIAYIQREHYEQVRIRTIYKETLKQHGFFLFH